MSNDGDD